MTSPLLSSDNATVLESIIDSLGHASPGLMISGEEGLGKEAIVQMLYGQSSLRGYPFIKINCPILSGPTESDSTPCVKEVSTHPNHSSFSLFRMFHQGVIYLHRVDELAHRLQERLLAIIRRKFLAAAAASGTRPKQVAIFSTALRPLPTCVSEGAFHPDLCDLLSGVSIHIPPLRKQTERIVDLVDYFLKRFAMRERVGRFPRPSFSHLAKLQSYHWPGNIRELQALVRHAVRSNDWDAALAVFTSGQRGKDDYLATHLTPESIALMPHFEVTRDSMLEQLSDKIAPEELGLMDLVLYEEMVANNKMH